MLTNGKSFLSQACILKVCSTLKGRGRTLTSLTGSSSATFINWSKSVAGKSTTNRANSSAKVTVALTSAIYTRPTVQPLFTSSMTSSTYTRPRPTVHVGLQPLFTSSYSTDLEEDPDLNDPNYKQAFQDHYLLPQTGHSVVVLLPDVKTRGSRKTRLASADLRLAEACALVDSLPGWRVIDEAIYSVKSDGMPFVFGKGNFAVISNTLKSTQNVTAVFISVDMLTVTQLVNLQKIWKRPVYDRYTLVLQIFQLRAQTREARLQVALAELPYLRSRLKGMHQGTLDQQRGGMQHIGGAGETYLEVRQRLLQEREIKLRKTLTLIKSQRNVMKQQRQRRELPSIAVVGYTNSGKTSLIKALSQDVAMTPENKLFATLDVTAHAGLLPCNMKVLYIDTVGFISDIPTSLIASFSATLEDMLTADVIVHVCDISHPDHVRQRLNVLQTLDSLNISAQLRENIIQVNNKVDLLQSVPEDDMLYISATTGQGLQDLAARLETAVVTVTGRLHKSFKVPMAGEHLSWLHKEAVVESTCTIEGDTESLMVKCVLTPAQYAKFKSIFHRKKTP